MQTRKPRRIGRTSLPRQVFFGVRYGSHGGGLPNPGRADLRACLQQVAGRAASWLAASRELYEAKGSWELEFEYLAGMDEPLWGLERVDQVGSQPSTPPADGSFSERNGLRLSNPLSRAIFPGL